MTTNDPEVEALLADLIGVGEASTPRRGMPEGCVGKKMLRNVDPRAQGASVEPSVVPSAIQILNPTSEDAAIDQPFFNNRTTPSTPAAERKYEKPEHRIIAMLKASGHTAVEIAELTGYSLCAIRDILRTPWADAVIRDEIKRAGRDKVQEVFLDAALESAQFLVEVRDNEKAPIAERRKAANDLLDRVYGKPNQSLTTTVKRDLGKLTDAELTEVIMKGRSN